MNTQIRMVDLRAGQHPAAFGRTAFDPEVLSETQTICERVRTEGDPAVVDLTRRHTGAEISGRIRVSDEEIAEASVSRRLEEALRRMAERLRELHARQVPESWEDEAGGIRYGERVRPLDSVGCYVPGGRAAYPSTVLMTAVPAVVAGVGRVIVCTPPSEDGSIPASVLVAARIAAAHDVFRVGGAQAVAALAFGTQTIPAVDKVVGPGNKWVTAAKRELFGEVGIDSLAGPTELVVVADATADPRALAADLVAQAEHDPAARCVLVLLTEEQLPPVNVALAREVDASPRRQIVQAALANAEVAVTEDVTRASQLVNRLAPEHLQVITTDPRGFLDRVRSFGAAFLGPHTPVSLGDYGVGSNHVLPTMGTSRFGSGLRASDFVTISPIVEATPEALDTFGPEVELMATAEGLPGHARASEVRR
jgi:histidinol dehydrogenase